MLKTFLCITGVVFIVMLLALAGVFGIILCAGIQGLPEIVKFVLALFVASVTIGTCFTFLEYCARKC